MKLKELQLQGFKSFIEKTQIAFPPGVSAIVGPNGCGKSNIVDALRWVMGEQSVKQLRGKSMEDVIFAGSSGRPPLNMAEVSLTLLNDNGSAPEELKDYAEIMVTRRLYRSGESEYLLNRRPCRLKDIHNIFVGSGMGSRTYAVIQQGNIGTITDADPQERRVFIEEAAGIIRYKIRKTEALRKIEATHQNLARLADILAELNRQMGSLKRQARKAEIYKKYQDRIRELDILITLHAHERISAEIEETRKLLEGLKDTDSAYATKLQQLDAAVEKIKLQGWQKSQEIAEQKNRRYENQRKADRLEADLAHARQDIERLASEIEAAVSGSRDLEQKLESIESEAAHYEKEKTRLEEELQAVKSALERERESTGDLKARLNERQTELDQAKSRHMDLIAEEARYKNVFQNTTQNRESLKRRIKRIGEEKLAAQRELERQRQHKEKLQAELTEAQEAVKAGAELIAECEKGLQAKKKDLAAMVKEAQTVELDLHKVRSRHGTLKKMAENYEWYKDGVRAIMKADTDNPPKIPDGAPAPALSGILGVMAEIIEPEPSYETAVEAALGEALQYVLVQDQPAGLGAIDYLHALHAGRSGFIPVAALKPTGAMSPEKSAKGSPLLSHVSISEGYEPLARPLLGHILVADSLNDALDLWNQNSGEGITIVTKDGAVVSQQGFLIGGSNGTSAGILSKKQELKGLEQELSELERQLQGMREKQQALETEARGLEDQLQKLIVQRNRDVQNEIEAEKTLYKAGEDLKNAQRSLEILSLEEEQLWGEEVDIDQEMTQQHAAVKEIEERIREAQENVSGLSAQISTLSARFEAGNQNLVDQKVKFTALTAGLDNCRNTLRRLHEFYEQGTQQREQLAREISQKKHKQETGHETIREHEKILNTLYEEIKEIDAAIETEQNAYEAIETELKANDGIIHDIQSQREKTLEKTRLLELEQSQRQIKIENFENRLQENHQQSSEQLKTQFGPMLAQQQQAPDFQIETLEEEMARLKKRISGMVDINLAAIKEYEEITVRHDFLLSQREDLISAIEDLHKVINKINRISREKFLETFENINAKLTEVFPRLFEGGSAQLIMTEPARPLETGVEFMVHPPGKKLTRMSLLSGGEKALSAIAFIFSIFLIKPASFCLMDEIDAPLDELNVVRFNDLLKIIGEQSQIVMVTHNKKTMEFADTLFGITMEQKGISKIVSVDLSPQAN